jgi:hypothetical protein
VRTKLQHAEPKAAAQIRQIASQPMQFIAGIDGDRGLRSVGGWTNAH